MTDMEDGRLTAAAHTFAELLQEGAVREDIDKLFMGYAWLRCCIVDTIQKKTAENSASGLRL